MYTGVLILVANFTLGTAGYQNEEPNVTHQLRRLKTQKAACLERVLTSTFPFPTSPQTNLLVMPESSEKNSSSEKRACPGNLPSTGRAAKRRKTDSAEEVRSRSGASPFCVIDVDEVLTCPFNHKATPTSIEGSGETEDEKRGPTRPNESIPVGPFYQAHHFVMNNPVFQDFTKDTSDADGMNSDFLTNVVLIGNS